MKPAAAIIGAGGWGTALAILLAKKGYHIDIWSRSCAQLINKKRENPDYLPGVRIPPTVRAHSQPGNWIKSHDLVLLAVPSQAMKSCLQLFLPHLRPAQIFVSAAKGIDRTTLQRMSQIIDSVLPSSKERILVLSGPNHAEEVARLVPTTTVIAGTDQVVLEEVQDFFMTSQFRVYTNDDMVGVETAGALKNIIALAAGISDGLGFGDNTKAAIMTRGLAEITRLGVAMGANPLTFLGLAGMGDLVATCTSPHSRNRQAGIAIGKGKDPNEVQSSSKMVVEGIPTAAAAKRLAGSYGVELPITNKVYEVLYQGLNPRQGVKDLMERGPKDERHGIFLSG